MYRIDPGEFNNYCVHQGLSCALGVTIVDIVTVAIVLQ